MSASYGLYGIFRTSCARIMGSLSVAHANRARFFLISGVSRVLRNSSSVSLSLVLIASMYSWYDFWRYFSICLPSEGADGDCAFAALVARRDSKRTRILKTCILPDAGWGNVSSCPFLWQVHQLVKSFICFSLCGLFQMYGECSVRPKVFIIFNG